MYTRRDALVGAAKIIQAVHENCNGEDVAETSSKSLRQMPFWLRWLKEHFDPGTAASQESECAYSESLTLIRESNVFSG
jgi:hypothetical protein